MSVDLTPIKSEALILSEFMSGQDRPTFARMISFFSVPGHYLHPREIKNFRNSISEEEWIDFKVDFWDYMVKVRQSEYQDIQSILAQF